MRWLVFFVLAALACQPAAAQSRQMFINGNELYEACQTDPDFCAGFITGIADALEALPWPTPRTCRPKGVELKQVLDFGLKTLQDNPEKRHEPAFDILADALVETWPC